MASDANVLHFDSRIVGSISAVSDNSRFWPQWSPVTTKSDTKSPISAQRTTINEVHPNFITPLPSHDNSLNESIELPAINKTSTNNMEDNIDVPAAQVTSILQDLDIDPSLLSSLQLSQTQIHKMFNTAIAFWV